MNIYSGIFPKKKVEGSKTLYVTEKGDFTKTAMIHRLIELGPDAYRDAFTKYLVSQKVVPLPYEVFLWMFCLEFYPALVNNKVMEDTTKRYCEDKLITEIEMPILKAFLDKDRKDASSKAGKVLYAYQGCVMQCFARGFYVEADDGHYYHLFDERITTDEERRTDIESLVYNLGEATWKSAIHGINDCFVNRKRIKDTKDIIEIINWYIRVGKILSSTAAIKSLAVVLQKWSKEDKLSRDITIAVFEDHQTELEKIYRTYHELDFVDRGRYTEYESVDAFAKAAGIKYSDDYGYEDLFVEQPETVERVYVGNRAHITPIAAKKDSHLYGVAILNAISELNALLKTHGAKRTKVLNIKPNEVKKRKAQVFGKYVAIAAKIDDKWWILVDSIKTENAIYLWHGDNYLEGLEIFKSNKAYALEQENVERRYHRSGKKTLDIYRDIFWGHGIFI